MAFEPPQRLVKALGETYGDTAAEDWLGQLPKTVQESVDRWELDVERVMAPGGRSSLVVLVRQPDGTAAALKAAPSFTTPALERAALERWDGWGAVRLLASSEDALLLERLHPEMSLRSLPEAKALLEAAGTVRRLWVEPPADHGFETVAERTARQAEAVRAFADPAATSLVAAALAARDELTALSPELLLLHGNFRQGKVLAADRTPWLAVGPEPLVGERAYDLARLVRDRVEDLIAASAGASAARRRVNKLADSLEVDRERLRGWTLFRAVESGTRAIAAGRRREGELALEFAGWL
ncbi:MULTISPECIES: aminoglycoside phosphotransferase family protein [unclassified Streptomyces]|uniref:aminoglycoside phosphotransferase family protein n=1 Tax=unclassified Streptomyces TaxID=2593676 RepID=UPI002DDC642D|nr:aminoglycoside phosphotransferase family protein [Streptomyces sp. NBC_01750]WSA99902.1 aminoglycoside phosphotransferase family protein [Streptomyces sp. NBC_01794]WSD35666.1 aminoglycoside phosphotransferase family protein [Streptomyces sp. NBC_01750]